MTIAIVVVGWLVIGFWGWVFYARTQGDVDNLILFICAVGSIVGILSWMIFFGAFIAHGWNESKKVWFKGFWE